MSFYPAWGLYANPVQCSQTCLGLMLSMILHWAGHMVPSMKFVYCMAISQAEMHPSIHPALGFRAGGGAMLAAPF